MMKGLTVSPKAIEEIHKLQAKRVADGKAPAKGLRVGIRGGGCTGFGYLFEWSDDEPRPTDKVFEFAADGKPIPPDDPAYGGVGDGKVKVYCDPKSLIYLDGTMLDFVTTMMGYGFKFVNPNVKGTCGCGESVQF
ncbi:MAG TPA: iron-sulfur cluster assembly accessory protein [Polyangiaceae bacterium]|nr:iron-sulfur cluster assembly accessory protein [Polyangiaceae bacterium]